MNIENLLANNESIIRYNEFEKDAILRYFEMFEKEHTIQNIEKIRAGWFFTKFYYIIELSSGDNGKNDWQKYFINLSKIFDKSKYERTLIKNMWLIEICNNCLNDLHNIYIGIEMK